MASERALELAKRIWKWEPHSEGQRNWMLSTAKVKVAACGRRWGKSESTAMDIVLDALEQPNIIQIVVAPTSDQTSIIMDEVERRLYSIPGFELGRDFEHRRSPYNEIKFIDAQTGAENAHDLRPATEIMARTAGITGRGLRGRKAHKVIVDEAAYVSDKIMAAVITPLLADYDGQRVEVSTPDGLNHFWDDFERGQDPARPEYESFQFPTSSNPLIPKDYIAREQATKPESAFAAEYLAEFRSREGSVFRAILTNLGAKAQDKAIKGHQYLMAVDWGRSNDYTVIGIADVTTRELVYLERFNKIEFKHQRSRLTTAFAKFLPVAIIAESNSIGQPNIEELQNNGLPVYGFNTSNQSKAAIVDDLAVALENGTFQLLPDDVLKAELMGFQGTKLPSGMMRYAAPEGKHDDIVIVLCLLAHGMKEFNQYAPTNPTTLAWETPLIGVSLL